MSGRKSRYADNKALLAEALKLHRAGASQAEIGKALGIKRVSVGSVLKLAKRTLVPPPQHQEVWLLAVSKPWRATA